jgi:hypothetical protein
MSPIDSFERTISLEYLKLLDSEISNLYHALEEDECISEDRWRVYEKMLDRLFYIVGTIEREF